jgi:2-oxoglutarate ferredoxin oxidoreductase subunit beta
MTASVYPTVPATDPSLLTKKDFQTDQDPRWCPGCGDYSILAQVQRILPELGIPKEQIVFISGIGCSSRFPYYMNTYGMHSIHGRAPAIASGVKTLRPGLSVWVVTGDGDALAIGGNHFIHALRRNMDLKILMFNNRIYGLTKGQYSPTSEQGKKTKSSPAGAPDYPFNPISVALSAEATFVARAADIDAKGLPAVLERAARHKGSAFIEIYQNCPIFNDGAHAYLTDRKTKAEHELRLEHGKPLRFGPNGEKGIALDARMQPVVVDVADVRRGPPAGARRAERLPRLLPQPPGPPRLPDPGRGLPLRRAPSPTSSSSTSRSRPPALARSSPYSRPSRPERPGQSPEARVRASRCSPPAESPCPIPGLPRCSFSVSRPSSAPRWCSSPGCSAPARRSTSRPDA